MCVQALTDAIEQGVYQPGSPLPSETDLAEQLEVSRATTLREALRTLEDPPAHHLPPPRPRHLRLPGPHRQRPAPQLRHHRHDPRRRRYHPRHHRRARHQRPPPPARPPTNSTSSPATPSPPCAAASGSPTNAPSCCPPRSCPARLVRPRRDAAALTHTRQSLYAYLYRHRGIAIYRGLAELTPVKATAELAAALEVPRGGLLLCISQVDYDDTGKAVMYSIEHHLPDWVRFTVERIGPGSAIDD